MGCGSSTQRIRQDEAELPARSRTDLNRVVAHSRSPVYIHNFNYNSNNQIYSNSQPFSQIELLQETSKWVAQQTHQSGRRTSSSQSASSQSRRQFQPRSCPEALPVVTRTPRHNESIETFTYTQHCGDCNVKVNAYVEISTPVGKSVNGRGSCSHNHHTLVKSMLPGKAEPRRVANTGYVGSVSSSDEDHDSDEGSISVIIPRSRSNANTDTCKSTFLSRDNLRLHDSISMPELAYGQSRYRGGSVAASSTKPPSYRTTDQHSTRRRAR